MDQDFITNRSDLGSPAGPATTLADDREGQPDSTPEPVTVALPGEHAENAVQIHKVVTGTMALIFSFLIVVLVL